MTTLSALTHYEYAGGATVLFLLSILNLNTNPTAIPTSPNMPNPVMPMGYIYVTANSLLNNQDAVGTNFMSTRVMFSSCSMWWSGNTTNGVGANVGIDFVKFVVYVLTAGRCSERLCNVHVCGSM